MDAGCPITRITWQPQRNALPEPRLRQPAASPDRNVIVHPAPRCLQRTAFRGGLRGIAGRFSAPITDRTTAARAHVYRCVTATYVLESVSLGEAL